MARELEARRDAAPEPARSGGREPVGPVGPVAVRWTIPRRIQVGAVVAALLVMVLGLVLGTTASDLRGGLRQIGHGAGPQVAAASDLYLALNDMDAQVANVLLVGDEPGLGVGRAPALAIYEQRRMRADEDVRQASAIADTGADGRQALRAVLDGLGRYEALAAEAILLDGQAHHAAGKAPPNVVARYRQATDLLRTRVLPAAQSLASSNAVALERTYAARRSGAREAGVWTASLGVALLVLLGGLQWFLARRFRRLVNPALVGGEFTKAVNGGKYIVSDDGARCSAGFKVGYRTGRTRGSVIQFDLTVNYGEGETVYGLYSTNACVALGDSGGPVYAGVAAIGVSGTNGSTRYLDCRSYIQPVNEALAWSGVEVY